MVYFIVSTKAAELTAYERIYQQVYRLLCSIIFDVVVDQIPLPIS